MLNGAEHAETRVPPATTVLDYLRDTLRLTGTKEGCAEGDCGACTVLVGRPGDGTFAWQPVNACLMLVPQLAGAALLTVEGLGRDGALSAAQRALMESDGTQCGFCTPGFVMAIEAMRRAGDPPRDDVIHDALAGNLCRCTGYRPIVEACRRALAAPTGLDDADEGAQRRGARPRVHAACATRRRSSATAFHASRGAPGRPGRGPAGAPRRRRHRSRPPGQQGERAAAVARLNRAGGRAADASTAMPTR